VYWNKQVFTSILLGILFSILFASADDAKSYAETKYIKLNADEFILPTTRGMTTEVMINGYVEDYLRGTDVYLIIENPNGEIEKQKLIASRGDYTTRIYLQHDSQLGEYKITTEYRGVNVDTISFVVIDKVILTNCSL